MSVNCLSEATIVRCLTLTQVQNGIIFVPSAVQVFVIIGLTALYWRSGKRKHYVLLAESCAYYALTLLDLLSHLIPQARVDLQFFKIFDIVIGSLSFVPVFLYTVFLYVIVRAFFLPKISEIPRKIAGYALLAFVPFAVAMEELSSFIGISYRDIQNRVGQSTLVMGFATPGDQTIWQFFTSINLALLVVVEVSVFVLAIFTAILIARSRQTSDNETAAPTVRGIAWVSAGMVLSAIETLLAFSNGGFQVVLARRFLRMFSRFLLIMGTLLCERATIFRSNEHRRRARTVSEIRQMISNPRTSTFMRLSTSGYNNLGMPGAKGKEPESRAGADMSPPRVTVEFDAKGGRSPRLALRLPVFDVPPAEVLTERFNRRGTLLGPPSRTTLNDFASSRSRSTSGDTSLPQSLSALARARAASGASGNDLPSELQFVRSSSRVRTRTRSNTYDSSARPNPRFRLRSLTRSFGLQSIRSSATGETESIAAPNARMFGSSGARHERLLSESSVGSDALSVVRSVDFSVISPRRARAGGYEADEADLPWLSEVEEQSVEGGLAHESRPDLPRKSTSIKRKPPPTLLEAAGVAVSSAASSSTETIPPQRANRSHDTFGQKRSTGSLRRKQMPIPPPINAALAREDPDAEQLAAEVQITQSPSVAASTDPYASVRSVGSSSMYSHVRYSLNPGRGGARANDRSAETPGMTLASARTGSSDAPTAYMPPQYALAMKGSDMDFELTHSDSRDPFRDSVDTHATFTTMASDVDPDADDDMHYEYDVAALESAQSGLGRIAARVANFDRLRRFSFRGGNDTPIESPGTTSKNDGRRERKTSGDTSPLAPPTRPFAISAPRPLASVRGRVASPGGRTHSTPSAWHGSSDAAGAGVGVPARPAIVRIKSVGRVATRRTPTPTSSARSFVRRSMRIDSAEFSEVEMSAASGSEGEDAWTHGRGRRAYYGRERGSTTAVADTPESGSVFSPSASGLSTPTAASSDARFNSVSEGTGSKGYTYTIGRAVRQRTLM